jgi:hypothetical protein
MRRLLTILGTVAALVGMTAVAVADTHYPEAAFDAQLSGGNEVPAITSNGSGYAYVAVSEDGSSIDYRLYAEGLDDVVQAHIHLGPADDNGPVVVFLFGPADPSVAADGLLASGTLTEADLIPTPDVFDGTMAQLVEEINSGNAYVNLHTDTQPAGEIRGQLAPAPFNFGASLSGANEVPPLTSEASGFTALSINDAQTAIDYRLITFGLVDIVQAHIHIGSADENGPVVVFLFGPEPDGVTQDGIIGQGTITEADLIEVPGVFDGSMAQFIDNLRAGTAYVNVHTMASPAGEIRGQVEGLERGIAGATFTDDDASVHEGNIETIAAAGITVGCNPPDNDEYCPTDELTRGQGAAFFSRALNLMQSDDDLFGDDDASIFEGDINAIASVGITLGCNPPDNDEFCPDDTVTREQTASFFARAMGWRNVGS